MLSEFHGKNGNIRRVGFRAAACIHAQPCAGPGGAGNRLRCAQRGILATRGNPILHLSGIGHFYCNRNFSRVKFFLSKYDLLRFTQCAGDGHDLPALHAFLHIAAQHAQKALQRIWDMHSEYDAVYNFHHDFRGFGSPLNPDVMPNLIHCLEMILDGTAEYRQIPDALSDCGATKTVAMYKDVFVSCMGQDIEKVI